MHIWFQVFLHRSGKLTWKLLWEIFCPSKKHFRKRTLKKEKCPYLNGLQRGGPKQQFLSPLFTYILRCGRSQMIRSPQLWFHGLKTGEWWRPWKSCWTSFFHGSQCCQGLGHLFLFKGHQSILKKKEKGYFKGEALKQVEMQWNFRDKKYKNDNFCLQS